MEKSLVKADTAFVVKLFIVTIEMVHKLSTKPKNAHGGGVVVSVRNGDPVHRVCDLFEFLVNVGQERSQ